MPPMPIRELVKQAYRSKKWAEKVDKMTDAQVFVLFVKFKNDKKI
jgi:hypothetical protein